MSSPGQSQSPLLPQVPAAVPLEDPLGPPPRKRRRRGESEDNDFVVDETDFDLNDHILPIEATEKSVSSSSVPLTGVKRPRLPDIPLKLPPSSAEPKVEVFTNMPLPHLRPAPSQSTFTPSVAASLAPSQLVLPIGEFKSRHLRNPILAFLRESGLRLTAKQVVEGLRKQVGAGPSREAAVGERRKGSVKHADLKAYLENLTLRSVLGSIYKILGECVIDGVLRVKRVTGANLYYISSGNSPPPPPPRSRSRSRSRSLSRDSSPPRRGLLGTSSRRRRKRPKRYLSDSDDDERALRQRVLQKERERSRVRAEGIEMRRIERAAKRAERLRKERERASTAASSSSSSTLPPPPPPPPPSSSTDSVPVVDLRLQSSRTVFAVVARLLIRDIRIRLQSVESPLPKKKKKKETSTSTSTQKLIQLNESFLSQNSMLGGLLFPASVLLHSKNLNLTAWDHYFSVLLFFGFVCRLCHDFNLLQHFHRHASVHSHITPALFALDSFLLRLSSQPVVGNKMILEKVFVDPPPTDLSLPALASRMVVLSHHQHQQQQQAIAIAKDPSVLQRYSPDNARPLIERVFLSFRHVFEEVGKEDVFDRIVEGVKLSSPASSLSPRTQVCVPKVLVPIPVPLPPTPSRIPVPLPTSNVYDDEEEEEEYSSDEEEEEEEEEEEFGDSSDEELCSEDLIWTGKPKKKKKKIPVEQLDEFCLSLGPPPALPLDDEEEEGKEQENSPPIHLPGPMMAFGSMRPLSLPPPPPPPRPLPPPRLLQTLPPPPKRTAISALSQTLPGLNMPLRQVVQSGLSLQQVLQFQQVDRMADASIHNVRLCDVMERIREAIVQEMSE